MTIIKSEPKNAYNFFVIINIIRHLLIFEPESIIVHGVMVLKIHKTIDVCERVVLLNLVIISDSDLTVYNTMW